MGPTALVGAANLNQYQMAQPKDVQAQQLQNYGMNAVRADYTPQAQGASMQGATTDYRPDLTAYQMQGPEQFTSAAAQRYMDPYMQGVVDVENARLLLTLKRTNWLETLLRVEKVRLDRRPIFWRLLSVSAT